ncbi:MAG: Hsp20/alpha crystallin family protein [Myxococcaceae bacterium]|nr:Hsp20/alpha crystallin family protein [Myxococcaceae bacterium]
MANITVRKTHGGQAATPASITPRDFDPLRSFRDMLRWDPFREMAPIWPAELAGEFSPAFEVKENATAYVFKADVPGIKDTELDVTVTGNRLTISGHRNEEKEDKNDTYYFCERKYGAFSRAYTLPEGADFEHVNAELNAGVLTIAVPKLASVQPKKIAVQSAPTKA